MKIVEERHPGEPWLLWKLGNLLTVDQDIMRSAGYVWGYKFADKWQWKPIRTADRSLFYNGILFIRFNWPFGIFFSVRWSSSTVKKALFQTGVGFKLNGRGAILFRIQSDATSAAGVTGENSGQAQKFDYGTH